MESLELYAVQNSDGQYFRAKGYGGGGQTWVPDLKKARIYAKPGPARTQISFFANHYPGYPTPKLVKLVVSSVEVIDETARVEEQKRKKDIQKAKYEERIRQGELERAQEQLVEAQKKIDRLNRAGRQFK